MSRHGDWMQTYSGRSFWPLDPHPEDVDIEDIAHALSQICRFTGHCENFYSVAEHCVHVSYIVPSEDALWGLMHDAAEAYVCDVARPLKRFLTNYKSIEDAVMVAICDRFGMGHEMPETVKRADNAMLAAEKEQLMKPAPANWCLPEPAANIEIECWPPLIAKLKFLARFNTLYVRD